MDDGIDALLASLTQQSTRTRNSLKEPRRRARAYLQELVDAFPRQHPQAAEIEGQVRCDGYRRERIRLEVIPGVSFSTYVLIPEHDPCDPPMPAVLAVHGHGYGSRQITGMLPDGSPHTSWKDGHHHFGVELVRHGMLVIAPDVAGFGERMSSTDRDFDPGASNGCYRLSQRLLLHGRTLAGLRTAELLGVLDYLAARSDVDPRCIGIMGHSGGAMLSALAAALDERIHAVVLSAYPNTFEDSIARVRHCACNYLPGILDIAEQPDLLALIAPRPLFIESGADDPIFPKSGFDKAVRHLRDTYAAHEACDAFEADIFPGGHEVCGRRAYDWLNYQLAEGLTSSQASQ